MDKIEAKKKRATTLATTLGLDYKFI